MTGTPTVDLERVVDHISGRHKGLVTEEEVRELVTDSYQSLAATARIHTYLSALMQRFATERVDALARTRGGSGRAVPQVLFLCVHNAGRSQMAAALLTHHALGRVDARSAGSAPSGELNQGVVDSLAEEGISLAHAFPKPITDEVARAADVVVSMGCGDSCPIAPGVRFLEWDVPDPSGLSKSEIAPIRDQIDRRVRHLLEELS